MKKKIFFPAAAFFAIFAFHAIYIIRKDLQIYNQWMQTEKMQSLNKIFGSQSREAGQWFHLYLTQQNYFLGISYALAGAFTVYAFLKTREKCNAGAAGVIGGITMSGIIYWAGCFFLGCCGSPMLMVYLGLFGPSFLGFTKPLVLILTLISVIIGCVWIEKKSKPANCCPDGNCRDNNE